MQAFNIGLVLVFVPFIIQQGFAETEVFVEFDNSEYQAEQSLVIMGENQFCTRA